MTQSEAQVRRSDSSAQPSAGEGWDGTNSAASGQQTQEAAVGRTKGSVGSPEPSKGGHDVPVEVATSLEMEANQASSGTAKDAPGVLCMDSSQTHDSASPMEVEETGERSFESQAPEGEIAIAPRQRQRRAAATAAAKTLKTFIAEEEKALQDAGDKEAAEVAEPPSKKSKYAAKKAGNLQGDGKRGVEHLKVSTPNSEGPNSRTADLVSMLTSGASNASRSSTPKTGSSLGDLIWPSRASNGLPREGLALLAQPGGLAALALAQPSQAAKLASNGPTSQSLKAEPLNAETPRAEPPKAEPLKAAVPKAEPLKTEPPKSEAIQIEPEQTGELEPTSEKTQIPAPGTPKAVESEGPTAQSNGVEKPKGRKGRPPGTTKAKKQAETPDAAPKAEVAPKRAYTKRKQAPEAPANIPEPAPEAVKLDSVEAVEAKKPKKRGRPPGTRNTQPRGRGKGHSRGRGRGRGRVAREETPASEPEISCGSDEDSRNEEEEKFDELFGCAGCHWHPHGCMECRTGTPVMLRPQNARWKPEEGRFQKGIPVAPTFHPTEEEFADPLSYINKIRPEGEKAGIACIVPPKGWSPPFALSKGTNGQSAESFRFSIRRQPTWQLCMRMPNVKRSGRKSAAGRYDAKKPDDQDESHVEGSVPDGDGEFGFVTLDRTHTLTSFEAYAQWAKCLHFGLKNEQAGDGPKRRRVSGRSEDPSVDEIEAEFWRIIETAEEVVESLYGQDLDSGHHGSGFPLPPFRKRLLEEHLTAKLGTEQDSNGRRPDPLKYTPEEEAYSEHCWNINNLPRCKGSVLRYVIGEELITGVMVPWLYVGSCMSAFCWHIEDHALYSINYLHKGAAKVWYGVPAHASDALDEAMRDALPHLFEAAPDLLYQLVTMLSPTQLQERGVPVHRLVHHEGSFVITFPNAYHAGFNTGFNCAEAVNFGPPDWLPWGCSILSKYRRDRKAATLSNDALLVALVKGAGAVHDAAVRRAEACSPSPVRVQLVVDADSDRVGVRLVAASSDGAVEKDSGDMEAARTERQTSGQGASTSGRHSVPGKRADTSYLDPIKVEDAPVEAVRLAAAELALRVREEKRRREKGLQQNPDLERRRMTGKPGDTDAAGLHTNTEDTDCMDCKCDLWMSALVSQACPGDCYCPEHASQLRCAPGDWILLYRYTLEELEGMLADAEEAVGGTREALAAAEEHLAHPPAYQVKKLGPITDLLHRSPISSPPPPEKLPEKRGKAIQKARSPSAVSDTKDEEMAEAVTEESAELSDSPIEPKRARKGRKEEGDWTPPKKRGRGPGKKRLEREAAAAAEVAQGLITVKPKEPSDPDKAADREPPGAARGRGRGRRGGRGRGKGSKRVVKQAAEEIAPELALGVQPKPHTEPAAVEAEAQEEHVEAAAAAPANEPPPQSDNSPAAIWAEAHRLAYTQGMAQQGVSQGFVSNPAATQFASLPASVQTQGFWKPQTTTGISQALPFASQGMQRPAAPTGNSSVLMEILKASVQAQPQGGHIAPGSVPLSQAMNVPTSSGPSSAAPEP